MQCRAWQILRVCAHKLRAVLCDSNLRAALPKHLEKRIEDARDKLGLPDEVRRFFELDRKRIGEVVRKCLHDVRKLDSLRPLRLASLRLLLRNRAKHGIEPLYLVVQALRVLGERFCVELAILEAIF